MIVLGIPFKDFKEKIAITRKYRSKGKVEILDNLIYVEMSNPELHNQ